MRCKKCGSEVADNIRLCPNCGERLKKDSFPVWVIVLLGVVAVSFFVLPFIGIVAALTIPSLLANTDSAKNKAVYKKSLSSLNQALLMSQAINDKTYSRFDDVWTIAIKGQMASPENIENGLKMLDGTEIKYEKLGNPCIQAPKEPTKHTACAILTIDANGFNKAPNKTTEKSSSGKYHDVNDQFKVLLYSTSVVPEKGSVEEEIINEYR